MALLYRTALILACLMLAPRTHPLSHGRHGRMSLFHAVPRAASSDQHHGTRTRARRNVWHLRFRMAELGRTLRQRRHR